jgi:hypothetical protein
VLWQAVVHYSEDNESEVEINVPETSGSRHTQRIRLEKLYFVYVFLIYFLRQTLIEAHSYCALEKEFYIVS